MMMLRVSFLSFLGLIFSSPVLFGQGGFRAKTLFGNPTPKPVAFAIQSIAATPEFAALGSEIPFFAQLSQYQELGAQLDRQHRRLMAPLAAAIPDWDHPTPLENESGRLSIDEPEDQAMESFAQGILNSSSEDRARWAKALGQNYQKTQEAFARAIREEAALLEEEIEAGGEGFSFQFLNSPHSFLFLAKAYFPAQAVQEAASAFEVLWAEKQKIESRKTLESLHRRRQEGLKDRARDEAPSIAAMDILRDVDIDARERDMQAAAEADSARRVRHSVTDGRLRFIYNGNRFYDFIPVENPLGRIQEGLYVGSEGVFEKVNVSYVGVDSGRLLRFEDANGYRYTLFLGEKGQEPRIRIERTEKSTGDPVWQVEGTLSWMPLETTTEEILNWKRREDDLFERRVPFLQKQTDLKFKASNFLEVVTPMSLLLSIGTIFLGLAEGEPGWLALLLLFPLALGFTRASWSMNKFDPAKSVAEKLIWPGRLLGVAALAFMYIGGSVPYAVGAMVYFIIGRYLFYWIRSTLKASDDALVGMPTELE